MYRPCPYTVTENVYLYGQRSKQIHSMKKTLFRATAPLFVIFAFFSPEINAQENYAAAAAELRQAINRYFYIDSTGYYREHAGYRPEDRAVSYLWPLCALIQADREEQVLSGTSGQVDKTFGIIKKYYDDRPPRPAYASYPPALGGGDRFFDDNQWIGIALMDAWAEEKNPLYLSVSRGIYDFMMTAYDTVGGGGLYWQEGKPTKNTCSNGPGIILSLQLYKATGEKGFLDTALLLYDWVNQNLRDSDGLYWDHITYPSRKIDYRRFPYNTGTMIQSGLYLYEISGDATYLRQAQASARAAHGYFLGQARLRDDLWFNAVLLRAYQHLLQHDKDTSHIAAFKTLVEAELKNHRGPDGLFLHNGQPVNLVNQAGMLEILNRLAYIETQK